MADPLQSEKECEWGQSSLARRHAWSRTGSSKRLRGWENLPEELPGTSLWPEVICWAGKGDWRWRGGVRVHREWPARSSRHVAGADTSSMRQGTPQKVMA